VCLIQLSVSSSRLEIFFSTSQQELPLVALPAQEKYISKSRSFSLLSGAKIIERLNDFKIEKFNPK
jgi:hypothetical protein